MKLKKTLKKGNGRSKFEKRSQEILKTVYKKREEKSQLGGKDILVADALPNYEPKIGENQLFIAPLGFSSKTGFHIEVPVHYGVGIAGDKFICPLRYKNEPCPRCEHQALETAKWRQAGGVKGEYPDLLKSMFPNDTCIYLVLDMGSEEGMSKGWQIWRAGKQKVHAEIISRTHDKKTGKFIDICDLSEGRIVYFEYNRKKGEFPTYKGFDLLEFDDPIPEEYVDALTEIIEAGEDKGGTIEQFLHVAPYKEIHTSHYTAVDSNGKDKKRKVKEETEDEPEEVNEEAIEKEIGDLNKFQLKQWIREHDLKVDTKGKDADDIRGAIMAELKGETSLPKCFGEALDNEECTECIYIDECVDKSQED